MGIFDQIKRLENNIITKVDIEDLTRRIFDEQEDIEKQEYTLETAFGRLIVKVPKSNINGLEEIFK